MKKTKAQADQKGLEYFIDNSMVLFTVGWVHFDREGIPCSVRRGDTYATPTEGEIECVLRYADCLASKVRWLRRWVKRAKKDQAKRAGPLALVRAAEKLAQAARKEK